METAFRIRKATGEEADRKAGDVEGVVKPGITESVSSLAGYVGTLEDRLGDLRRKLQPLSKDLPGKMLGKNEEGYPGSEVRQEVDRVTDRVRTVTDWVEEMIEALDD